MKEKLAAAMAVAKKNLVSIICGLIALIAVGAIVWPINGYFAELSTTAEARGKEYGELNKLLTNTRQLPLTTPAAEGTTAPKLEQFPTQAVINTWKTATDRFNAESDKMFAMAVELNQGKHALLRENALPKGSLADLLQFRQLYRERMDISPLGRPKSFVFQYLHAGAPPTPQEIEAAKREVDNRMKQFQGVMPADAFKNQVEQEKLAVQDTLRQSVAKDCNIYVVFDPQPAIAPYEPLITQGTTAIEQSDVFRGQLTMWVQEDVLKAIAAVNANSTKVADSTVKHLISMRISPSSLAPFAMPAGGTPPPAPATEPSVAIEKKPISPTQRTSNGLYDVIRFSLRVVVDAEQAPRFLRELSNNQFITVNNVNLRTVDLGQRQMQGYLYGDKPVVQLDMSCEELLLRKWTMPYMPSTVKVALGLEAPSATPAP